MDGTCETFDAFSECHCVRFVPEDELENARTREDIVALYTAALGAEGVEERGEYAAPVPYTESPVTSVVRFTQDFPKSDELTAALREHPELTEEQTEGLADHQYDRELAEGTGLYIGGWFNWCQGEEYPDCPECGQTMNGTVLNIESLAVIDLMLGDCGTAQICQCPTHERQMTMVWACG
ncbi:hypothetical protein KIPB_005586 [Kipferlia bialata]|uniref:Uncharacterized protein n=1 Tax=Kipferlia bialata TaxID=797122 RepID=A0A9K3CXH7_9EUKA|nr:hypothetical protein KIPB_005586 [Kipferlia bialata]|eukprot:g5586.t1